MIDGKRTVWKGNTQQQPWIQFDLVVEIFVSKVLSSLSFYLIIVSLSPHFIIIMLTFLSRLDLAVEIFVSRGFMRLLSYLVILSLSCHLHYHIIIIVLCYHLIVIIIIFNLTFSLQRFLLSLLSHVVILSFSSHLIIWSLSSAWPCCREFCCKGFVIVINHLIEINSYNLTLSSSHLSQRLSSSSPWNSSSYLNWLAGHFWNWQLCGVRWIWWCCTTCWGNHHHPHHAQTNKRLKNKQKNEWMNK